MSCARPRIRQRFHQGNGIHGVVVAKEEGPQQEFDVPGCFQQVCIAPIKSANINIGLRHDAMIGM